MSARAALAPSAVCLALALALPLLTRGDPPVREAERTPPPRAALTDLYGDPLPDGAVARLGTVRWRHADSINAAAFSPDGAAFVTHSYDRFIRVWDADTGKERRAIPMPATSPSSSLADPTAFFSDGKRVGAPDDEGGLHGFDMETGKEVFVVKPAKTPTERRICRGLSPDGKVALFEARGAAPGVPELTGRVYLYDTATSKELQALWLADERGARFVFSRDGARLLAFSNRWLQLWDVGTGKQVARRPGFGWVLDATFSPDGKTLALGDENGAVTLFDADLCNARSFLAFDHPVYSLSFSGDGKRLAAGGMDRQVRVWDMADLHERCAFRVDQGGGRVVFSPTRPVVAVVSCNMVLLYDAEKGERLFDPNGHNAAVTSLAFSSDGKTLATTCGGEDVRLWDPATGKERLMLQGHDGGIRALAFSPDGRTLASSVQMNLGVGSMRLWDVGAGKELREIDRPGWPLAAAFSPDGKRLSFCEGDNEAGRQPRGRVLLWDSALKGQIAEMPDTGVNVRSVAFSPDGGALLVADGAVGLWDVAAGKRRDLYRPRPEPPCRQAALSPDGKLAAGVLEDGRVVVWEAATGATLFDRKAHLPYPRSVAFAPQGWILATGGENGAVRLWDAANGDELRLFDAGPENGVNALAFSPDGRRLASGCDNTTVLIWDVTVVRPRPATEDLTEEALAESWKALTDADAGAAWSAVARLAAGPAPSVSLLKERLRPAPAVDGKKIAWLVADLDSDDFAAREAATRRLADEGERAEAALRKALEGSPSPELHRRAGRLLKDLKDGSSPEQLRAVRATAVLEYADSPEARRLLEALAGGAEDARLTQEAKAALARLDRRAAASKP
jgi:WD40 repeat protein